MKKFSLFIVYSLLSTIAHATTYYIAPAGDDANNCTAAQSSSTPKKTFSSLFGCGTTSDTFLVMDGTMTIANNGYINQDTESLCGGRCAQPPNGTSGSYTTVQAVNDGMAIINGDPAGNYSQALRVGSGSTISHHINYVGLRFATTGIDNYSGNHIYYQRCGFNGSVGGEAILSFGTNDNDNGVNYITVEDSWVYGSARIGAIIFRSDHIILRRVIIRNDGCNSAVPACGNNSGNFMVGYTVYNSSTVSLQNVITVDCIRGPNGFAGASDIQTAWHTSADGSQAAKKFGMNEWLGDMSVNTGLDGCAHFEHDNATPNFLNPVFTIQNLSCSSGTYNMDVNGTPGTAYIASATYVTVRVNGSGDFPMRAQYAVNAASFIRSAMVNNVTGNATDLVNSTIGVSYMDVSGPTSGNTYRSGTQSCSVGCYTIDPTTSSPVALKYPTRIETGSDMATAGYTGNPIGATILKRYGTDGTFYGDSNFDTLSATNLWPWPNETRMRLEMCTQAGISRGWCAGSKTFTTYVWEQFGNTIPADIYGTPGATTKGQATGKITFKNVNFK